jgi:hypothetical protein
LYLLRGLMRRDGPLAGQQLEAVAQVDLTTIEAMTEEVRRRPLLVAAAWLTPSWRPQPATRSLLCRHRHPPSCSAPHGRGARVAGGAVREFGTREGRSLEMPLIAPEAPDQAWVCYGDDQQQQLIPLAEI